MTALKPLNGFGIADKETRGLLNPAESSKKATAVFNFPDYSSSVPQFIYADFYII